MFGQTTIMEKSAKCTAAVAAWTIGKFGADDDTMSTATTPASDSLLGIFQHATTVANEEVRLMHQGISRLKLGGTVTRGQKITCDGSGQGIASAPSAGANVHVIGIALASGVSGDIIPCLIAPSVMQG